MIIGGRSEGETRGSPRRLALAVGECYLAAHLALDIRRKRQNAQGEAMAGKGVLQADHPQWPEFCEALAIRLGPVDDSACTHTDERPLARGILGAMGFDVERTLVYFDQNGGGCDCEILVSVDGDDSGEVGDDLDDERDDDDWDDWEDDDL